MIQDNEQGEGATNDPVGYPEQSYVEGVIDLADMIERDKTANWLAVAGVLRDCAALVRHYAQMDWSPIETAPYSTPVKIKVGEGMEFIARLEPDGAMSDLDTYCDQWRAEYEGEHPECWHDGCCWESNADEVASLQPEAWAPLPPMNQGGE